MFTEIVHILRFAFCIQINVENKVYHFNKIDFFRLDFWLPFISLEL